MWNHIESLVLTLLFLPLLLQPLAYAQAPAAGRPSSPSNPPNQVPIQSPDQASGPSGPLPSSSDEYSCPTDNGAQYTSGNGVTFTLMCDHGTHAAGLDSTWKFTSSQKACADYCSDNVECQSCDWDVVTKLCQRKKEVRIMSILQFWSANFSSIYQ